MGLKGGFTLDTEEGEMAKPANWTYGRCVACNTRVRIVGGAVAAHQARATSTAPRTMNGRCLDSGSLTYLPDLKVEEVTC